MHRKPTEDEVETAQSTPGPWRIADLNKQGMFNNDGSGVVLAGDNDDSVRICTVAAHSPAKRGKGHELDCSVREANARLIAAAPDLLRTSQAVLRWYAAHGKSTPDDTWTPELAKLHAAVSRATSLAD